MALYVSTLRLAGWIVVALVLKVTSVSTTMSKVMQPDRCPVGIVCTTP